MGDLQTYWEDILQSDGSEKQQQWWARKKALCKKRDAEMTRIKGNGKVYQKMRTSEGQQVRYLLHLQILVRQGKHFYMEEQTLPFIWTPEASDASHLLAKDMKEVKVPVLDLLGDENMERERFSYDRMAAVQYAETWWNSYNPAYREFDVDCTNYVSQCLHAGGAPMRGAPNRGKGWWYQGNNWSYSWAVAHSLRWYLSGSTQGLKGFEVKTPQELAPGDVICYDFEGDGRFNHNTIVVSKDAYGMPLVNAHTYNTRNHYWSYEDSPAWTPDIQYKFFRIGVS